MMYGSFSAPVPQPSGELEAWSIKAAYAQKLVAKAGIRARQSTCAVAGASPSSALSLPLCSGPLCISRVTASAGSGTCGMPAEAPRRFCCTELVRVLAGRWTHIAAKGRCYDPSGSCLPLSQSHHWFRGTRQTRAVPLHAATSRKPSMCCKCHMGLSGYWISTWCMPCSQFARPPFDCQCHEQVC